MPDLRIRTGYSRITDAEMKLIMKNAVDRVFALLWLKSSKPEQYEKEIKFGERYATKWDDPTGSEISRDRRAVRASHSDLPAQESRLNSQSGPWWA